MTPAGMIKLPVTKRAAPLYKTLLATFIVLNCPSAYNVVMGRPILVDLRAVVSKHHLSMKFPTTKGVGYLQGNWKTARECYDSSISKAKKTGVIVYLLG